MLNVEPRKSWVEGVEDEAEDNNKVFDEDTLEME